MEVLTAKQRPPAVSRLDGSMREERLLSSAPGEGAWELVRASLDKGACVLPVPFPTEEIGLVLSGRVELTELDPDYDVTEPLDSQATIAVLEAGDAFRFLPGERIWMEVLEDATLVYARRIS